MVTNPVTDVDADEVLGKSQDRAYHLHNIPPDPTKTGVLMPRDEHITGQGWRQLRREVKYGEGEIVPGLKKEPQSQVVVEAEVAEVPTHE